MKQIKPAAASLDEASILLDGHQALVPSTPEFDQFYIARPQVESNLLREAVRADRAGRHFGWFFTGHTGSGKSTELNRIITDQALASRYLPIVIDLESESNIHNLTHTDLILAIAKACATKADELSCGVSPELSQAIARWDSEIFNEQEISSRTEGQGSFKLALPFLALGQEVKLGGGKREVIRRKIQNDITGFIRLINELANTLAQHTGYKILCVLDGLDHVDAKPCQDLLANNFETIMLPAVSKIIVIPLALLNTPFMAVIERQFSTVPNIKVFAEPGSRELDPDGLSFYRQLIARYVALDLFSDEALESLFRLSAGIVRDMIRNTGDACGYAYEQGAPRVELAQVERVWSEVTQYYRRQLTTQDYEVLRKVESSPHLEGIDGVPPLLHSKAVVFYPNGEGWYGVHPVIRRMIGVTDSAPH